ncbi:hypothetical protein J6TS1_35780 [Siminovitchia terrae]|uniref:Uncharacterized protein n=1 Tax=Siminovitchia terrae TaxID=1914933 RepID=A0ABQ4L0A2_SIMTE|nr:hypothetical protein [Siminovitchia terrae]GIN90922.1 hypothetical protein J22TS1_19730 [Siminovitchia terrae]GIN97708.1 hypothetical protein J6TS1_35780 [Siminovitchia terrae]
MSISEENQLFVRELRRLLDDYERSPRNKKTAIMEDILILAHALYKSND